MRSKEPIKIHIFDVGVSRVLALTLCPLPAGEGREHRTLQDRLSGGELPYRPLRGLIRQFELWQGKILSNVVEHHLHTFANGDIHLSLRIELIIHQIGDQAYTFLWRRDTPLLVQFDNHDRKGGNVAKAWLDGVHNDFIGIYRTLATDLLPTPLQGLAPRAPGAWRISHKPASRTLFQHQSMLLRCLKIPEEFTLVLWDNQLHPAILYKGHLFYLRIIKALPVTGLAHPRFIEISASRTWRHFPSE